MDHTDECVYSYTKTASHSLLRIWTPTQTRASARSHARSAVTLLTAALPVGLKQSGHRIAFSPSPSRSGTQAQAPRARTHTHSRADAQRHWSALSNACRLFIRLHYQICQAPNSGHVFGSKRAKRRNNEHARKRTKMCFHAVIFLISHCDDY